MQTNRWFPRSIRNRLAMFLGLVSLGLFITWNLLPRILASYHGSKIRTAAGFWSDIYYSLLKINSAKLDAYEIMSAMATILVTLLALINFSFLPAWKLWQASALLRVIPATLMLIGFIIVFYFTFKDFRVFNKNVLFFFTISANFLTTAIALLLFKNESFDTPHAI
jgi:hypothetical protein